MHTLTYNKQNTSTDNGVCAFWGVKYPTIVTIGGTPLDLRFLSNFYNAPFRAPLVTIGTNTDITELADWTSSEQYFMYRKAMFFCDTEIAHKIRKQDQDGNYYKSLGRKVGDATVRPNVKPFDATHWSKVSAEIMFDTLVYKFSTNTKLGDKLRKTDRHVLVEASPYDKIWGAGVDKYNLDTDPTNWPGQNLLGFTLMQVRDVIAQPAQK